MTRLYHNLSNNKVLADNYCKGGKIRILGAVMQLLNKSTDYIIVDIYSCMSAMQLHVFQKLE